MNEAKLYVGNLPYTVNKDQLAELFGQVGEVVDAAVITERDSGRSKGFGFVTMASAELAQKAIEEFNQKEFNGRTLVVNVARPKA